jgi:hypothetical protein
VVVSALLGGASRALATVADMNPDHLAGWAAGGNLAPAGRVVGIAVNPTDKSVAWALAENAGVFGTTDGGRHWAGNALANGAPGPYGRGLNGQGLTKFDDIAVDPNDPSVLLLIADTDHRIRNTKQGIWRSNDGGASWHHVGIPPCEIAYAGYGEGTQSGAHLLFAPSTVGDVVVTTPCGVGESTDHGQTWAWDVTGSAPLASGVAAVTAPGAGKVPTDYFAMCGARFAPGPESVVGIWPSGGSPTWYQMPTGSNGASGCSVAFNPGDRATVYLGAWSGGAAHVYEGALSGAGVSWTDLNGPTAYNANGRPIIVATHVDGTGFRLYYSNTTLFTYLECAVTCPHPATASGENCAPTITGPWTCMAYFHPDFTGIAFDPSMPTTACPLFAVGDGGVVGETACGVQSNNGLPLDVGLHALQVYQASLTDDRDLLLATQDNAVLQRRSGVWRSEFCGDGTSTDALGRAQVRACNGTTVVSPAATAEPHWPWDSHPIFPPSPVGLMPGVPLQFSSQGALVAPIVQAAPHVAHALSIAVSRSLGAAGWAHLTPGTSVPVDGTACCGAFAIGGRGQPAGVERRFYVSLPSSSSTLARTLYCHESSGWSTATGVADPVGVWSAPWAQHYTLVWDAATEALYRETAGPPCHFAIDRQASSLITGNGAWADPIDPGSRRWLVSDIGFDPNRPGRAFIATTHNGVLTTTDFGVGWADSHSYPEPNGGIASFLFADADVSSGRVEPVIAASWGRGVWAVTFDPATRYPGLPQTRVSEAAGRRFRLRVTCPGLITCAGSIRLVVYLHPRHGITRSLTIKTVRIRKLRARHTGTFELTVPVRTQRRLKHGTYRASVTATFSGRGQATSTASRIVIAHFF